MKLTRNRVIAAGVVAAAVIFLLTRGKEPQTSKVHEPIVCVGTFCEKPDAASDVQGTTRRGVAHKSVPEAKPETRKQDAGSVMRSKLLSPPERAALFKSKSPLSESEQGILKIYCECSGTEESAAKENELLIAAIGRNATMAEKTEVYMKILVNTEGECSCSFMQIQGNLLTKLFSLLDQMQPLDRVSYIITLRASDVLFPGLNFTLDSKMQAELLKIKDNKAKYSTEDLAVLATEFDALAEQTGEEVYSEYANWLR